MKSLISFPERIIEGENKISDALLIKEIFLKSNQKYVRNYQKKVYLKERKEFVSRI